MTTEYSIGAPLLSVEHVSVRYGKHGALVLRDVHFTVNDIIRPGLTQGQVLAVLGPSGVGKSTLFNVMAGLHKAQFGQCLIGREQRPVTPGDMGVVLQNYYVFEHYTVMENLVKAGRMTRRQHKEVDEHALALLAEFGIADKADVYAKNLSGGQRQRVAIAQQLMCSGDFLLMDEPFSGLDPIMKQKTCETINKVARMGDDKTIVVITHDISAALAVADRVLLLGRERDAEGKIVPGAYIKADINTIERGLAWHEDVTLQPEFGAVSAEIRAAFRDL